MPDNKGRTRTQVQHDRVEQGRNPLTNTPKHPDAPDDCTPYDRFPRPGTCGTCRFLLLIEQGSKPTLKCGFDPPRYPRITLSASTDVRRWWPGCGDYQPGES